MKISNTSIMHRSGYAFHTGKCRLIYPGLCILGNLPVERAKDSVCFLQRCGVSLVSSYAVCFLQRGGVSLPSSAIIYNIVKVKVTRRPVWPVDPSTHWPVNPLTPCAFCSGVAWAWRRLLSYIILWKWKWKWPIEPFDPLTRRPIDLLEKEPPYIRRWHAAQQKAPN